MRIPPDKWGGHKCLLSGRQREQRSQREAPSIFGSHLPSASEAHPLHLWFQVLRNASSLPPTSDDQVLQGGPGTGEVPLLAVLRREVGISCW